MAVTSIWSIKGWIGKVINYAENPDKTKEQMNQELVSESETGQLQGLNDVMSTLNQGYIRKLYNTVAEKYESVAKNVRTIMKTSLEYAFNKNVLATNPAKGINLPKKIKKTEYRVLKIDEKKTLTLPQVLQLIEASKETPIHMQILFAVFVVVKHFCNTLFENSPGISSFKWCFPIIVGMRTDMIVPYVHISV